MVKYITTMHVTNKLMSNIVYNDITIISFCNVQRSTHTSTRCFVQINHAGSEYNHGVAYYICNTLLNTQLSSMQLHLWINGQKHCIIISRD